MKTLVKARIEKLQTLLPVKVAAVSFAVVVLFGSAEGATLNIQSYGATPNDGSDDATAINNAMNASVAGDTILFPSGVYNISSTLTLKSDRNYSGAGATLKRSGTDVFAVQTEWDNGKNVFIDGLTFDNGGISFAGSGNVRANNIDIRNATFKNIVHVTYPYNTGIYIPIGAVNCEFVGNSFTNVMGDNGLITWNLDTCLITDNRFDLVNEGMHLNGATVNTKVLRNTGVRLHRMGIEIQGSGNLNLTVEDNHFSNWNAPYSDSFGLSIVPGNGPNVLTRYNTVLARPPVPGTWTDRFGFGIELGGDNFCRDNFVEGHWWHGIVIGGVNVMVSNNICRGPHDGQYKEPATIATEPGSGNPITIVSNTLTITSTYIEPPGRLSATVVSATRVDLSWIDSSGNETGFAVQRRSPGGNYSQIASLAANVTSYSDTSVSGNTEYVYRIQPFNASEQSYSHVVWVKTPVLTTPAAPSGLTATTVSSSQINLAWTDNANNETGFKIERKTGAGGTYAQIATAGANATSFNNSGLSSATTYYYRVRATNSSGDSAYSNEANATTQSSGGGGGAGLQAEYYDNIDFTNLKTTRTDATVNFDFGTGIPAGTALTSGDTFSVRWTGQVQPQFSETYTFYTVSDDGVRLWVNNQLLIDKWIDQAPTEWSGNITVTANQKYDIRMDFYENGGGAQARLSWSSASTPKAIIPQSQLFLPPSGTVYVSDLAWASALNGWGPVEKDKSNGETGAGDGTTITLNGTTYAKGLGVHANSEVVYNVNGAYSAFLADVGVDDEVGASGSVVFQVWADGTKIYDSGTMNGSTATTSVNVSIAGKNQIKLTVTDAGDGNSYDHADWANARFTSSGATVSVNDNTIGTGNNQFEYVSSANWPFSPEPGAFNNDNHYSQTVNAYYQVRFSGTQVKVYTKKNSNHGIMAISIDGGTETNADSYSSTTVQQALVYTSPLLAAGQHTLKVRVTGTKNASSTDTWIIADRVDVLP